MSKPSVLIVDDQPNWRSTFSDLLGDEYETICVKSYEEAIKTLDRDPPFRVAIVDIRLDDKDRTNEDGLHLLGQLKGKGTNSIVVTGYPTVRTMKEALHQLGAFDYIEKYPEDGKDFDPSSFRQIVHKAVDAFVFVVMPFADQYTAIYENVIKETVKAKGLACKRADDFHNPSWIMNDIRKCIDKATFLIADFSDRNLNVFYEVGMAHARGQNVVLLTQTIKDVPPTLRGVRCIRYENSLDGAKKLGSELSETLDDLQQNGFHSRPVFARNHYSADPKLCLVLIPRADSTAREAYEQVVREVMEKHDLNCSNIQSIFSTKQIMDAIWRSLNQARVVVADLSGGDPEVFYLTGISHGLDKDVILLAQNEEDIPFNLRESSHIIYATKPLEEGLKAKQEFDRVLKQVLMKPFPQTPGSSKETLMKGRSGSEKVKPVDRDKPPTGQKKPPGIQQIDGGEAIATEQYADFSLHIGPSGHARAVSEEGERRVTISLDIPTEVDLMAGLVEQDQATEELLKKFGKRLYEIIFPNSIDILLNQTEAVGRSKGHKLRIRLTVEPDELARLPWEFTYREEGGYFLSVNPDTVLSRYLNLPLPQGYVRAHEGPLHMLIIIAGPKDLTPIDPDKWEKYVTDALVEPIQGGLITTTAVKTATFENVRDALLKQKPDIVQFIGHGAYDNGKGYLALVDSNSGGRWVVDDKQFASIFSGFTDHLGLVCLTACEGAKSDSPQGFLGIAPQIVQKGVPAVVAMQYPISFAAGKIFLENFYKALAARKPVDWATQFARNAISIKQGTSNREFATPVLFMRAKDGNIF